MSVERGQGGDNLCHWTRRYANACIHNPTGDLLTMTAGDGEPNGLSDEDMEQSVKTLEEIAKLCEADISLIRKRTEEAVCGTHDACQLLGNPTHSWH